MKRVTIVGGGLAGSEAAWQLASRGVAVDLVEMRPGTSSGAHRSDRLAEIVCSNSFKSTLPDTASGLLKKELGILGSILLNVAEECRVPAGHALAVDREAFASTVTSMIEGHPMINVVRRRQSDLELPGPFILATGPLTHASLLQELEKHLGRGFLFFYDAISPSIDGDTVDRDLCFEASRYGKGTPDYLNVPLDEEQYADLVDRIRESDAVEPHEFEDASYFEACLPIEVMARRGRDTLRFGPLKPKGLVDPRTGREPYAVIQLRREKADGSLLGLVGFQTRLKRSAQSALIRAIPALRNAAILRFGAVHRNVFIRTPEVCIPYQKDRKASSIHYAGQICGVEGYVECIASGLVAALDVYAEMVGSRLPDLPGASMIGALMKYIHTPNPRFQPMNANMGLLPPLERRVKNRSQRNRLLADRAQATILRYRAENSALFPDIDPRA
jgi:methylenetetrahydrofolate--tRNA-(uracil-5-)-methyltransferase